MTGREKRIIEKIWDESPEVLECEYLRMGDEELGQLPAFDGEGNVVFYDIGGGYLLGKLGLIRFVKTVRDGKKYI